MSCCKETKYEPKYIAEDECGCDCPPARTKAELTMVDSVEELLCNIMTLVEVGKKTEEYEKVNDLINDLCSRFNV